MSLRICPCESAMMLIVLYRSILVSILIRCVRMRVYRWSLLLNFFSMTSITKSYFSQASEVEISIHIQQILAIILCLAVVFFFSFLFCHQSPNTTHRFPCKIIRSSKCASIALSNTFRSKTRPFLTNCSTESRWEQAMTSCSMIGPSSNISVV